MDSKNIKKLEINRKKVREISMQTLKGVNGGGRIQGGGPYAPTAQTGTSGTCSGNCCI